MKKQTKYTHIKKAERLEIAILLGKGHSIRRIAGALKRDHGSVSWEIKENSVNGVYDPKKLTTKPMSEGNTLNIRVRISTRTVSSGNT